MLVAIGTVQAQCLPGVEHGDRLLGMHGDGRDQMHGVDAVVSEDRVKVGDALFDFKAVAHFLQHLRIRVADGQAFDIGMMLEDGQEFSAEAEPGEGDLDFARYGHSPCFIPRLGQVTQAGQPPATPTVSTTECRPYKIARTIS